MGKKQSKVYSIPNDEFKKLIDNSYTYSDVLRKLGLTPRGGSSLDVLKRRILELNCSVEHFDLRKSNKTMSRRFALCEILVENSSYNSIACLKKRLIHSGLLEYKCSLCGNTGEWNNQRLVLELDHKNGINNDHRLSNLRFLCPNCHSQTSTYGSRNRKKR